LTIIEQTTLVSFVDCSEEQIPTSKATWRCSRRMVKNYTIDCSKLLLFHSKNFLCIECTRWSRTILIKKYVYSTYNFSIILFNPHISQLSERMYTNSGKETSISHYETRIFSIFTQWQWYYSKKQHTNTQTINDILHAVNTMQKKKSKAINGGL
jgi:hypothetical protein